MIHRRRAQARGAARVSGLPPIVGSWLKGEVTDSRIEHEVAICRKALKGWKEADVKRLWIRLDHELGVLVRSESYLLGTVADQAATYGIRPRVRRSPIRSDASLGLAVQSLTVL
jgi:hypothetical protein